MRKFYTNANMLIRKFFKCTVDVKCYLFKTYCSTLYCSAMWFDSTKSAMKKLKVTMTMTMNDNDNDNKIDLFRHHNGNNTNIKVIFKQMTTLDKCNCI